jgi:diacylglycerol kinase (ATP)
VGRLPRQPNAHPGAATSLTRLRAAFRVAFAGIAAVWATSGNFRIEVVVWALALALGLLLRTGVVPILILCALVLSLEMMNCALEAAVDLASPELHPLAKHAKDAAAGAVLVAALISVIVGLWLLGPPLLAMIGLL